MFQQLELEFFRQHEALTINFEKGVIALRGANEKGKSTILEGIAYAMFGARALREPIDDVVTWGQKVSKLRTRLRFGLNGVNYLISRGKSGAEIKDADTNRILATGQDEVTGYVETLLGASRDVATKLMLANQDDIKGTLSQPGASVKLIETLANLGVIDTIISLVQDTMPSGSTVSVEARIETMEVQVADPVEDNTGPLAVTHNQATLHESIQQGEYDAAKKAYNALSVPAGTAQALINRVAQVQAEEGRLRADLERAKATLAAHIIPALPTNIPELRKCVEDVQYMDRAARAAEIIGAVQEPENEWEGDIDSLLAEIAETRNKLAQSSDRISELRRDIAVLESQKIVQTACGLCGKDLSNVPEVVAKNADLQRGIDAKEAVLDELVSQNQSDTTILAALEAIRLAHYAFMNTYQRVAEFVTLTHTHCPPKYEWSGPAELEEVDPVKAAAALRTAEMNERAHHAAVGRRQQLEAEVVRLQKDWEAEASLREGLEAMVPKAQADLDAAATALAALNAADGKRLDAQRAVQAARQALEVAQAGLRERQRAREALEAQLKTAREELAEIADNNALIKFLREARVMVTDQLWAMVTTTVSSYFSDIRGTQSVVTREDNGFKVDGRNVSGLSGSTKDALGLAIRKALTKTMLPNIPFMMLDEPAAACDDDRETNMLGLIANSGFEQVILITHSDLADSFANQVISL